MADFDPLGLFKNIKTLEQQQKITLGISVFVFILSFFFPAFYIDRKDNDAYSQGWYLLVLGWTGLMVDIKCIVWMANPLYLLSLLLFIKRSYLGIFFAILATLVAYQFSTFNQITTSESGATSAITLQLGYKLWVLSFGILALGSIVSLVMKSASRFRHKSKNVH